MGTVIDATPYRLSSWHFAFVIETGTRAIAAPRLAVVQVAKVTRLFSMDPVIKHVVGRSGCRFRF
jgi:hypothetical protein